MSSCDCRRLPTWDCLELRAFEEECTISRCAMSRSTVCEKFRRKEMEKLAEIMIIGHTAKGTTVVCVFGVSALFCIGNIVSSNKYKQVSRRLSARCARWRGVGKLRNNEVDHYSVWKIFILVARTLDLFPPLPRMAKRHI